MGASFGTPSSISTPASSSPWSAMSAMFGSSSSLGGAGATSPFAGQTSFGAATPPGECDSNRFVASRTHHQAQLAVPLQQQRVLLACLEAHPRPSAALLCLEVNSSRLPRFLLLAPHLPLIIRCGRGGSRAILIVSLLTKISRSGSTLVPEESEALG
jgi:hypothetical protein